MSLDAATRDRIASLIGSSPVVLFMKGDRSQPQCGFSASVIEMLDNLIPEYATVDVLADPAIRDGIKEFSSWPTIPQLYVRGEFVGGCDIITELFAAGDLQRTLGLPVGEPAAPTVQISDAAAAALRELGSHSERRDKVVHLGIDARFRASLYFASPGEGGLVIEANGIDVHMDGLAARRADGVRLDLIETDEGPAFHIHNPNAPAES